MNKNTLIITTVSIIAMFAFLAGAYFLTSKPEVSEYPQLKTVRGDDHTKWSNKNQIVLVEYSDLQCPGCQYAHTLVTGLEKDPDFAKIKENVTFVYRHFPLDSIHPNARQAAYSAEAANKQGKFFEWTDVLFSKQSEWGPSDKPQEYFLTYAKSLKLDLDQFKKDMASKEVQERVQKDFLSGSEVNIPGTPTFFLNGKAIDTPQTVEAFKTLLMSEIK